MISVQCCLRSHRHYILPFLHSARIYQNSLWVSQFHVLSMKQEVRCLFDVSWGLSSSGETKKKGGRRRKEARGGRGRRGGGGGGRRRERKRGRRAMNKSHKFILHRWSNENEREMMKLNRVEGKCFVNEMGKLHLPQFYPHVNGSLPSPLLFLEPLSCYIFL